MIPEPPLFVVLTDAVKRYSYLLGQTELFFNLSREFRVEELLESQTTRNTYSSAYSLLLLLPTSSPKRALIISIPPTLRFFGIAVVAYGGIPPSFSRIKTYEHSLVQHDWSVQPNSSGDYEEKYISFPDHLWGHGFNNVLQEM